MNSSIQHIRGPEGHPFEKVRLLWTPEGGIALEAKGKAVMSMSFLSPNVKLVLTRPGPKSKNAAD